MIPDRFHAICRCARRDIPWLLPSQKLHPDEAAFRDELRHDMSRFSEETLDMIIESAYDRDWLKRIAMAERLHRDKKP